jgi:uncharacterized membrane protein YfcA
MSAGEDLVLLAAAFVGGVCNSIAGGGSLVTFPALVWLGRDPIIANATNTVTLWPGSLAAMAGMRSELAAVRPWLPALVGASLAGGALGAVLLLWTPSPVFAAIVPWLILFATALFALQGPLTRALSRAPVPALEARGAGALFQLLVSVYGGYFGAGMGIMMLAGFGLLGFADLHHVIGLRNVCAVATNAVAAVIFVVQGAVNWPDVLVLTIGQVAGGYSGARLVRRLGRELVRRFVIVMGLVMAASFLFRG